MKKNNNNVSLIAILGAIVCLTGCILTADSELAKIVCSMALGMHIMSLVDAVQKRKRDKQ